jgi:hypothetical protein
MTRREYKSLRVHWSVMCASIRLPSWRAEWFKWFELLGRERRLCGKRRTYGSIRNAMASLESTGETGLPVKPIPSYAA